MYVTVSENELKQELAKSIHSEVVVINLNSSEDYQAYTHCSSVAKLSSLSTDLHQYDLSQEQKETLFQIQNTPETPVEYTTVKVRFGTNESLETRSQTLTLQQLVKHLKGTKNYLSRFEPQKFVGFIDEDVTDHLELGSPTLGLLSVTPEQHTYLREQLHESLYLTYEELSEESESTDSLVTNEGLYDINQLKESNKSVTMVVVPQYLKDKLTPFFEDMSTQNFLDIFSSLIQYNASQEIGLVLLITPEEEELLRPVIEQKESVILYFESSCYSVEMLPSISDTTSSFNGTNFYGLIKAHNRPNISETIIEFMKSSKFQNGQSAVSIIDDFVEMKSEES
jgi:hypothetical protein